MIEIKNVSYQYESTSAYALRDVSMKIVPGEMVAIVGPNGSGKSTLAKHLNGLLLPQSGEVLVDGRSTANNDDLLRIRQTVGMVFQNPDNQLVTTIVEEDVAFGPENLGIVPAEIRERVDRSLRAVGMEAYAQHAPHMLSGGQKQRIAIAGMLAMEPRVLVLDEATAMLDPSGRKEVLKTVSELNRTRGITVIMITQFMEEAALCDRMTVMANGRIVLEGTPHELFAREQDLLAYSLDVPVMAHLAAMLRRDGVAFDTNPITVAEMAEALCPLLLKN